MAKNQKTKKQKPNPNETKAERFIRLVTPRVIKAVKSIKLIGNCSASSYEYTPEQILKMTETLQSALDSMTDKYAASPQVESEFTFTT